jgi:hypothetical protein
MGSVAGAVIGTVVGLKGQRDVKKAQQRAANDQRQAALENANMLDRSGRQAEADILRQNAAALQAAGQAAVEAEEPIAAFADTGAFQQSFDDIIGNLPISGPLADSIRQASTDFVKSRPEFNITGPVSKALEREGDLAVGAATEGFRDAMLGQAQQEIAATGDISQIRQRGLGRLADIAGGAATQRASALIGQTPQLTQLATGASEARLLGDVAGQRFRTGAAETIARGAGQVFQDVSRRRRGDQFDFGTDEDIFDPRNF